MTIQQMFLATPAGGYPDDTFWVKTIDRDSNDNYSMDTFKSLSADEKGNIYAMSLKYYAGGVQKYGIGLLKIDAEGDIVWQRVHYSDPAGNHSLETENALGVSPDGASIYTGNRSDNGMYITRWNSSGVVQWTKCLGSTSNANNAPGGIAKMSSDAPIIAGASNEFNRAFLVKLTNAGAITWQAYVKNTAPGNQWGDLRADRAAPWIMPFEDSAGNIHSIYHQREGSTAQQCGVVKHNSSGVWQSEANYSAGTSEDAFKTIVVDSNGNKYIGARYKASSDPLYRVVVIKLNSSDVIQWQREIYNATDDSSMDPKRMWITSNDEVITLSYDWRTNHAHVFTRHQADGTLVWKRTFRHASSSVQTGSFAGGVLNRNENIVTAFPLSSNPDSLFLAQLPGDGTATGKYGDFIWVDASEISEGSFSGYSKGSTTQFESSSHTMSASAVTAVQTADHTLDETALQAVATASSYSDADLRYVGNAIGNMTQSGGLGRAFDGTTSGDYQVSARKDASYGAWIGKNFVTALNIRKVTVYRPDGTGSSGSNCFPGEGGGNSYLEYSDDGSSWTTAKTMGSTTSKSYTIDDDNANVTKQYWRVRWDGDGNGGSVRECKFSMST